jgi:uncharacterized protein YycO
MLRIAFCRGTSLPSRFIRVLTWSRWSHVALIDDDEVIEAVWPRVGVTALSDLLSRYPEVRIAEWPTIDAAPILAAARSQEGKGFDWKALIGFIFHRDWQQQDAWFCSELVAWSFAQAGVSLYRPDGLNRITPQHLWILEPR